MLVTRPGQQATKFEPFISEDIIAGAGMNGGGGKSCHFCHFLVARGGMKKSGKNGQLATFATFFARRRL